MSVAELRLLRHMQHDMATVGDPVSEHTPINSFPLIYRQRTQFEIAAADRYVSTNCRRYGVPGVPELHSSRLGRTKRSGGG